MAYSVSFVVLVVIMVLGPTPLAAQVPETAVRIDESGAVVVPVRINGRGPFPFLLDTGSSHSVISDSLVDRLELRFVARTSILTSTGREWRPVVRLDQTAIEGIRPDTLLASVAPSKGLAEIAHGIDGIVGQDFLFGLNYTLDYRGNRLIWNELAGAEGGIRLPLVAQGGRYLVQAGSTGEAAPLLLVPDSGASGFVAFERNGLTRLALMPMPGRTMVNSVSGRRSVRTMRLRELRLGPLVVKGESVAIVPRSADDMLEGDGLLPLHLFASVSFNARERCLVIRR